MNAFAIPLLFFAVGDDPVKPKLPLGKDTTVVSGPLDKNGYIDYEAALNERLGKGIKPEQNANVLLWQAFGPRPEGSKVPPEIFKALGISEPPEKGDYFVPFLKFARDALNRDEEAAQATVTVLDHPLSETWQERDFPDLTAWLKANEKPLAVVAEAVKRPAYFNPLCSPREPGEMSNVIEGRLPLMQNCRQLAQALSARAALRLAEGKQAEAWADLLTAHRLARHVAHGGALIEALVGYAVHARLMQPTVLYFERADLKTDQILGRLAELQKLSPFPPLTEKLDGGERFMLLDAVQRFRAGKVESQKLGILEALAFEGLQWDITLKHVNATYDRAAETIRLKTRAERVKATELLIADVQAMARARMKGPDYQKLEKEIGAIPAASKTIGLILVGHVFPAFPKVQDAADRAEQNERNLHVAIALAAYRKAHGRYPAQLADLALKFLPTVPDDPFTEKPLIYKPDANGYLLYSVGLNAKDDGGTGDDLAVRVPLPKP